ncbi:Inositol polyphosphate multikinase [Trichoplax sp. H2]|nr:Inositol polyphosphate multikinase [Trichoplax sp. H2]|eukprot:RDD46902.1 Inositol polyphosphate multikinase [Trichoplax sp. H2]
MLSSEDVKDDLDDFIYQAAGHQYINGFRTFLKCNDGTLLKIFQDGNRGHREMEFYSEIFSANHDSDQTASALRHFMPTYFGTVTIKNDKNSQPYMKISDVTSKFKRPCVIDLKIGRRTYDPLATEAKRARAVDKYPLQDQIGFRIDGMKVYNSDTGNYDDYDKIFGRKLDDDTIVNGLSLFYPKEEGWKISLIDNTILRLQALLQWFNSQSRWLFFSSSLLIVYDSDKDSSNEVDIKLVDFTHTYESAVVMNDTNANCTDNNTIYGLNSLLKKLNELKVRC